MIVVLVLDSCPKVVAKDRGQVHLQQLVPAAIVILAHD